MEDKSITRLDSLRRLLGRMNPFLSGALGAILILLVYVFLNSSMQLSESEINDVVANAMASATPRTPDAVLVYQSVLPSIVAIEAGYEDENGNHNSSLGTGVIIDDSANILTSLHVVQNSRDIEVSFADGSKSGAFIIISTPEQDIAVLRAFNTPQSFVPATLGNPGTMRVGDDVFVIGHPFGYYASMSAGVISGFDRVFHPSDDVTLTGLIQFDAAANPGNSGGPLLNRDGHVIGVVTGVVSPSESKFFVGIGFAVPITTVAGGGGSPPY